ncbi:DUF1566 domain-containing protein [Leucothrix sargassi]|nr:DUF1566 domain-containing protein [Leucothrix sargassi]
MRLLKKALYQSIATVLCGLPLATITLSASADEIPTEWPTAFKDIAIATDNQQIIIPVLENDTGEELTLTSVNEWSTDGGKIVINPDKQTVSYYKLGEPDTWPETDSFWYVFSDKYGRTNAGQVEVVLGDQTPPEAWPQTAADSANTVVDAPIKIDVLSNDTGVGLTIKSVNTSSVGWGRITIQGSELYYTPYAGFKGSDEFWYVMADAFGRTNAAKVTVNVTEPSDIVVGRLNDTGTVECGDYAYGASVQHNNNLTTCSGTDADGDEIPPKQDATHGRDATDNDDTDGVAGFSFTKLSVTGEVLPASAETWSCVKDNVTGLIWESKVGHSAGYGAAGLHSADDVYTYYNTNESTNGGYAPGFERHGSNKASCFGYIDGQPETYCNTQAFVSRVNAEGYCGITNWRVPNPSELQSIVNYDGSLPTIDKTYFPNTAYSHYTTSALNVRQSVFSTPVVKYVAFYDGHTPQKQANEFFGSQSLRLVSQPLTTVSVPQ